MIKNLERDEWYTHQTHPTYDCILNFNQKICNNSTPKKEQKDKFKWEQADALKQLHEEQCSYFQIPSIVLPNFFIIINNYLHHKHCSASYDFPVDKSIPSGICIKISSCKSPYRNTVSTSTISMIQPLKRTSTNTNLNVISPTTGANANP